MDLDRELAGDLAPLWLVMGDARPQVDAAVQRIVQAGLARCGLPSFNHTTCQASDADAVTAVATARTLPMMADLRLVVVRNMQEGSDDLFEAVAEYAADPSPSTLFVLTGEAFPKVRKGGKNWSSRVQNAVKKTGRILKFDAKSQSPVQFATEQAKVHGKTLQRRDADLLVELVGTELGRVAQEVAKVAMYVGDAPAITADDIAAACSAIAESDVWLLTSAIARRDPDAALATLHRQLEEGENPRRLLGLIGWQFRQILEGLQVLRQGGSANDASRVQGITRTLAQDLAATYARGEAPTAAEALGRLARANLAMNSHRAGDRHVLEALVLELCT